MIEVSGCYKDAAEMWEKFRLNTPESRAERRLVKQKFLWKHPNGHRDSIRSELIELSAYGKADEDIPWPFQFLNQIHPRAWKIILEHGKDYRPTMFRKSSVRECPVQPSTRECYINSLGLMVEAHCCDRDSNLTYVEGCVSGPVIWLQLHAWNGVGFSKRAMDWSFYPVTSWCRYFGVPFSFEEYKFILKTDQPDRPPIGMLFDRLTFPMYEAAIREVLKKPRTRLIEK